MTSRGAEKMNNDTIGVDVRRKTISTPTGWPTAPPGVSPMTREVTAKALIKWLAETPSEPCRVRTDRALSSRHRTRALCASGVPFIKVNPRQARRFAEATGKLAKTDFAWMRRFWLVCGRIAGIGGAPSPKRGLVRTEGASHTSLA